MYVTQTDRLRRLCEGTAKLKEMISAIKNPW